MAYDYEEDMLDMYNNERVWLRNYKTRRTMGRSRLIREIAAIITKDVAREERRCKRNKIM